MSFAERGRAVSEIPRRAGALQGIIVILPATLAAMGTVVLIPVLPQVLANYASIKNSDYLIQGGVLTLPSLCIALFSPLAGLLGDRYGRRGMLIAATTAYAFVGAAPLFIENLYAIIVTRLLVGVCEAAILTASTTLICDYFSGPERKKWLAAQVAVAAFAAVILTVAAGAVGSAFGWKAPFALYGVSLVIALGALMFTWEPERDATAEAVSANSAAGQLNWKRIVTVVVVTTLGAMLFYIAQTQNGNLLASLGVTKPAIIGVVSGAAAAGVITGTFVFRGVSRHIDSRILIMMGFFLSGCGYFWMGLTRDYPVFSTAAFAANIALGMLMPTILVWAVGTLPFASRARGNGIWAAAWATGQFTGALAVNYLQRSYGGWLSAYSLIGEFVIVVSIGSALFFARRLFAGSTLKPQWPK